MTHTSIHMQSSRSNQARPPENDPVAVAHALPAAEVLGALSVTREQGLAETEVRRRLGLYGENVLRTRAAASVWRILLNQFESPVVILLGAVAILTFVLSDWQEGVAIAVVLAINALIGFVTEIRAVRSMEALRKLGGQSARVRRDGRVRMLQANELVPGDIVLLEGGDMVAADMRLVEASNLASDESTLTGESVAVDKSVDPAGPDAMLAERSSMLFKGTAITRGSAEAVVTATGLATQIGRISELVMEADSGSTPLEKRLEKLSGQLIWVIVVLAAIVGIVGILRGGDPFMMVKSAVALAVAGIPEGLPIVATMALARGMWRMARYNAVIRRLAAVETLGATTVILTDKTGTLTENRMVARILWLPDGRIEIDHATRSFARTGAAADPDGDPGLRAALEVAVLCNNATLGDGDDGDDARGGDTGEPTELALLGAGRLAGLEHDDLVRRFPEIAEYAFDTTIKMMATVHEGADRAFAAVKGSPEAVLDAADRIAGEGGDAPLDEAARDLWLDYTRQLASEGLRVLGLARRRLEPGGGFSYEGLTFLGLVGLYDPPRGDVREAIRGCRKAGIRVVMVTGDHAVTASSIAGRVGLSDGDTANVFEGHKLGAVDAMDDGERDRLFRADVFARVTPAQKLDLVAAYQSAGEIVAMTGDGVNDAPALQKADIGIAMGTRGTQVAREAADMVLRDDSFPTIVHAMREGRVIFGNLRRFIAYLMSCNLSEILVVSLAVLTGLPLPLLPLQILFLNLVTDVFPAFALGAGEGGSDVLNRPPRDPKEPLISRRTWRVIVVHGCLITAATLGALVTARVWLELDSRAATTVSFLTLAFVQLWQVFNMRSPRACVFDNQVTRNPYVWMALLLCTAILLAAVYLPVLSGPLEIVHPDATAWGVILGFSLAPLVVIQAGMIVMRRWGGARNGRTR